jgi:hypothetical protein
MANQRRTLDESNVAVLACFAVTSANAQTATRTAPTAPRSPSCKAEATTKKLAGAALTSFKKKCETDSTTACDAAAVDKKLAGAAKTSFSKKCVIDSIGE